LEDFRFLRFRSIHLLGKTHLLIHGPVHCLRQFNRWFGDRSRRGCVEPTRVPVRMI
jgi:hypothetical protein